LKALIVAESYRCIFKARYSKKDLIIKKSIFRKILEKEFFEICGHDR